MSEIRIIHLEDDPLDAELVLVRLLSEGVSGVVRRVQTRPELEATLEAGDCDLVLADYSLPQFDGLTALRLVRERYPDLPFIFVTGALGEELAIETLRAGATDYVLKHRLERLAPAVQRALREAREREERRQMAGELAQRAAQLAAANQQLAGAVEKLAGANEQLADIDRRKDEFLAMLAHELRNPLAPIMTALHILRQQPGLDSRATHFQDMMDRQVRHLVRLVDDLLDISRITQGKITLHNERLDFGRLVRQVLEAAGSMIRQREQTLTVTQPEQPLWLDGDATRLEQVLQNLLNNASKYTPQGGQIALRVDGNQRRVVLRVRDTGVGIAPEILPHVFEPFVQAGQSLDRAAGGLGIGLTLVRTLVMMHGGQVCAHSDGPGEGSEFAIELPLAVEVEREVVLVDPPVMARALDGASDGPSAPARVSALVVDDNVDAAQSLGDLLHEWGYEVYLAYDGSMALAAARERHPDVVLLDIGLPGMNGYEVARHLRQEPAINPALLLAVTGYGQEDDCRQSAQAGFDRHFTKPVDLEALLHTLETVTHHA